VLQITGIFFAIGAPSIWAWLWLGASLQRVLRSPRAVRLFNWSMATLLLGSLVPVFAELATQFL
jgi:threonine/homoserine/homoserine lactone efflux protein